MRSSRDAIDGASLLLAALGHAGAVHVDLEVSPQVLFICEAAPLHARMAAARPALVRSPLGCAEAGALDAMVKRPSASIATRLNFVIVSTPGWMAALSGRGG
jgi:hypothetical protein